MCFSDIITCFIINIAFVSSAVIPFGLSKGEIFVDWLNEVIREKSESGKRAPMTFEELEKDLERFHIPKVDKIKPNAISKIVDKIFNTPLTREFVDKYQLTNVEFNEGTTDNKLYKPS